VCVCVCVCVCARARASVCCSPTLGNANGVSVFSIAAPTVSRYRYKPAALVGASL
jgi:hypothetical protein